MKSEIQTVEEIASSPQNIEAVDKALRENGKVWLRYVGRVGPTADTICGILYQGGVVMVEPTEAPYILSCGQWQLLKRGRCRGLMEHSGERCVQECKEPGGDMCAWHLIEQESEPRKGAENGR